MFHSRFTLALATALIASCPTLPHAEISSNVFIPAWQQADGMPTLVSSLEAWLDAKADWPRRDAVPQVRFVSAWHAAARQGAEAGLQRGRHRGLYDPQRSEILLVRPWAPRKPDDVSVLLHELVHHRQAPYHWYCPAAQELPAYRLQEAWLLEQGLSLDVDWMSVVLDAGCTPRDIHPE